MKVYTFQWFVVKCGSFTCQQFVVFFILYTFENVGKKGKELL